MGASTVWNINSTASGGGVAEMLRVLVGYTRGVGLNARWLVINGDPEFFAITKRLHNRIHGVRGDEGALGTAEARHYEEVTGANADVVLERVRPGDVVILHDPQTAGLSRALATAGTRVVWRCHIGTDRSDDHTEQAWRFLLPHLDACQAFVFTRRAYVPAQIVPDRVAVIPPSIDPFSAKNQELAGPVVDAILCQAGYLAPGSAAVDATFVRDDGTTGTVTSLASFLAEGPPPDRATPLVVQVSRWDRLKDMQGVMSGFAERTAPRVDADLALVGPSVEGVADDPEGAEVLADCVAAWEALAPPLRRRVRLISLPMQDVEENAAMVNAFQRHASIIVQKSLVEGFGLTVAEGMWKAKPVIGSAVGGIVDQIAPGTGLLLADPTDLAAYGDALGRPSGTAHRNRPARLPGTAPRARSVRRRPPPPAVRSTAATTRLSRRGSRGGAFSSTSAVASSVYPCVASVGQPHSVGGSLPASHWRNHRCEDLSGSGQRSRSLPPPSASSSPAP